MVVVVEVVVVARGAEACPVQSRRVRNRQRQHPTRALIRTQHQSRTLVVTKFRVSESTSAVHYPSCPRE